MTKPILFIETPRAGKHNHRFIAPEGYTGGDRVLSQWADFARQQAQGADCFSARREVTQQTSGRTGVEQLILAGVDAKQLSKTQSDTVRAFLQQHLLDVERLVTQSIDWDKITKNIVLRTELNQWQQALEQQLGTVIPAVSVDAVKQDTPKRRQMGSYWLLIAIEMVVIPIGIAVVINNQNVPPSITPAQGDRQTRNNTGDESVKIPEPTSDAKGNITIQKPVDIPTTTQSNSTIATLPKMFENEELVSMLWYNRRSDDLKPSKELTECANEITLLIDKNTDLAMSLERVIENWAKSNREYIKGILSSCQTTGKKSTNYPSYYNWVMNCVVKESKVKQSTDNDTLKKIKNLYKTCACAVTTSSQECQNQ